MLILGAGFAGSYVARLLGKRAPELEVTLVDPRNYMLYTPLLPEAASGTVEPRHAVVPVRVMCPKARLLLGRATAVDMARRTVTVQPAEGDPFEEGFDTPDLEAANALLERLGAHSTHPKPIPT